jgi:hypothetical protein
VLHADNRHDITEILLKVALNTIKPNQLHVDIKTETQWFWVRSPYYLFALGPFALKVGPFALIIIYMKVIENKWSINDIWWSKNLEILNLVLTKSLSTSQSVTKFETISVMGPG